MAEVIISTLPPIEATQKRYEYDVNNNMVYEGWAQQAALSSDPVWAIKKFTYSGVNLVQEQWAFGTTNMSNVWDQRAIIRYA